MKTWLEDRALSSPEAPALMHATIQLNYRQLAEQVGSLAGDLQHRGIQAGHRVALKLGSCALDNALWLHALWWRAASVMPVGPALSGANLESLGEEIAIDHYLNVEATEPGLGNAKAPVTAEDFAPPAPMTLMLTSGTSAKPRAIPLRPDHHLSSIDAITERLNLRADDIWLCCLPLNHIGGLAILLRAMRIGAGVRLTDKFDAAELADVLDTRPVHWLSLVPTQLDDLVSAHPTPFDTDLRGVLVGGAPCSADLLDHARSLGLPLLPTWGMTEAASQLATPIVRRASEIDFLSHPGWVGSPLPGVKTKIDDAGRLFVRGPMLYPTNPDDSRQASVDDRSWFATDDRAKMLANGELQILGRMDRTLIAGGINVQLDELERYLMRNAPVRDVALVALEHPRWGQRVGAVAVALSDVTEKHLGDWSRENLAPPERPIRWALVDEIPRSSLGKPRNQALRSLLKLA